MRTIYIICMIALLGAIMVTPASATTWHVYPGQSIQAAINNASDGDTVFVHAGIYVEEVAINKPNIMLKGEGADKVILKGTVVTGNNIAIGNIEAAPGCIVEGFKIINNNYGVTIWGSSPHCIIRNNVFTALDTALDSGAWNTTFMNNVVVNTTNDYGAVWLHDCQFSKVVNNTIRDNVGAGIIIYSDIGTAANNTITGNNISSNGYGIFAYYAGSGHRIYLNDFVDNGLTATTFGSTPPSVTYWNSTEPNEYVYNGTTYTNYLGNYWSDYSGADGDSNGIGDTSYVLPESLGEDYRPLMAKFESYPAPAAAEPPHLVTYTISNRTITPPQTTEIDVEFSETVSYKIAIEKGTATIYDWTGTAKNPAPKIWNGTYEANGTVVPDGDYRVNITGTNTTTGLSVINNTEIITVTGAKPDLIPTAIKPYHFEWWDAYNVPKGDPWFNLTNYVNVTVKNNGSGSASGFKVKLYADAELIGEKTISLAAGSTTDVKFEWKPTGEDPLSWVDTAQGSKITHIPTDKTYTLTAKVDEANEVPEENETNNNLTKSQKVVWNGYTGDEPLQNYIKGKVKGGMFYSTGDGDYQGVGSPGATYGTYYNVSYNLEIPGTPKLSRLYIYYTWAQSSPPPHEAPKIGVTLTTPSGTHTLTMDKGYNDYKGNFGAWNYPWGTYAYNITAYVTASGAYKVSVTNLNDGSDANFATKYAFAAPAILTVYENNSMPLREYWINEGADILLGGRRGDGGFLAWWECMNNATFSGSVSLKNATLGLVSPWGEALPYSPNVLYFNDIELGRSVFNNGWDQIGDISLGGIRMTGSGAAQVGVNLSDVTPYLAVTNNRVTQADDGDNMMPSNAFLLVDAPEGTLTVNKVVIPGADTGKFNLWVDGTTKATDVSNGGTTGLVHVSVGSHTAGEIAGTGTSLSNYTTVISGDCASDGTVTLAEGDNKVCTITNTRIPTLTVNKVVIPGTDTGKFNLTIDGVTKAIDVSNGGTTGQVLVTTGSHTVNETAGTGTDLSQYTTVISGDCAPDGTVTLANGDNKVCTITNMRGMRIDLGGPYDTEIGRHIMVPIKANQFTKFYGTVEMNFSYDTSKFDVVAVHSSSQSTVTAYQDYPSTGILDISAMNAAGIRGDVVLATVELKVVAGINTSSKPELTVDLLEDIYGATIFAYTVPATVNIGNPGDLTVTSVTSTPQSALGSSLSAILNENTRPRHTGDNETQITANVTDSGLGINSVTVDLSAIGGSAATLMEGPYPGTGQYKVKTKATAGVNGTHFFVVTAKDNGGNTATGSTNSLTIYRRGDVVRNNIVDMGDSLYIARYTVGLQTIPDMNNFKFVGDLMPASDSDYTVNMGDALYIARHSVGLEPAP